jgi:hypothetical protein
MAPNKLTAVCPLAVPRATVFFEGLRGLATRREVVHTEWDFIRFVSVD